jgi:thermitase
MRKVLSGLFVLTLLMGTLTLAFNIQPVRTEPTVYSQHKIQETVNNANLTYTDLPSLKDWVLQAKESDLVNRLTAREMSGFRASLPQLCMGSLPNEMEQGESPRVEADPVKLVIGLDETRPNGYSELANMIASREGKLVDTVAMAGKISAIVADIPGVALSTFVSEVKGAGLSRYIEPDMKFRIDFVPDDPYWSIQWGPQKIEADYAWNTTIGNHSILVAVIDSGIDWHHPDLVANYVPLGYDWVNNDTNPMDDNGHGTHCAGIIAAVLNNSIGVAGLAQVRIMAEKAMDQQGVGYEDNLANAIVHAVDQGANILSLSFGAYGEFTLIHEAVKYAYDHGALVIASAGNDAIECLHYPAAYEEVVAVTATNDSDNPASFTNFGDWVEVAAPGVDIYSTMPTYHVRLNDLGHSMNYDYLSGTSMACPIVAGVGALIWSQFPNMTRDQVRARLRYTADDLGNPGFDIHCGYGRVNARSAAEQALPEHDMDLLCWNTPYVLKPFDTATINGTLLNFGTNNESDITVQLLVNGIAGATESITALASGASTTVSYLWNPTAEGKYNVTLYVVPVDGEISTENNLQSEYLIVTSSEIVTVPNDFERIQKAINEVSTEYTIQVAPGTYNEHLLIDKSIVLVGENRNTTIVDGNEVKSVMTVANEQGNVNVSGFTIQNSGRLINDGGVILYSSNNNISGNTITNCGYGIEILESTNNTMTDNIISNSWIGIDLELSGGNLLENNCMIKNHYNFHIYGTTLSDFMNDIDPSNTVDGKPIFYLVNQQARTVPENAGYVAAINSTEITVKNLNLTNNEEGVLFVNVTNSTIANSCASVNVVGFHLQQSSGNVIDGNMAVGNLIVGIWQENCNANIVSNNTASGSAVGIGLTETSNSNVTDNRIFNNQFLFAMAIDLESAYNNTIVCNTIRNNIYGVSFSDSVNNTLYHNNFIKNTHQVILWKPQINIWDDGYPSGGNYWSDYDGTDSNGDGVGDTPYTISVDALDRYPLMTPWTRVPGDINLDGSVSLADLTALANVYGSRSSDANWNPFADLAKPWRTIGLTDLVTIAMHYGQHYP